jgi:hypothetical protein
MLLLKLDALLLPLRPPKRHSRDLQSPQKILILSPRKEPLTKQR